MKRFILVCLLASPPLHAAVLKPQLFLDCQDLLTTEIPTARPSDFPRIFLKLPQAKFRSWVKVVRRAKADDLPEVKSQRVTDKANTWIANFGEIDPLTPTYRALLDGKRLVIVKVVDPRLADYDWLNEIRNSLILASIRVAPFYYGSFRDRQRKLHLVYHATPAGRADYGLKWLRARSVDRQASGSSVPLLFPFSPQHAQSISSLGGILTALGYRKLAEHDLRIRSNGGAYLADLAGLTTDPRLPDTISADLSADAQEIQRLLLE